MRSQVVFLVLYIAMFSTPRTSSILVYIYSIACVYIYSANSIKRPISVSASSVFY